MKEGPLAFLGSHSQHHQQLSARASGRGGGEGGRLQERGGGGAPKAWGVQLPQEHFTCCGPPYNAHGGESF